MDISALNAFASEARSCAMAMLENATYISGELDAVTMDDTLRTRTREVCGRLIGTKHDVIHELFELDELIGSDAAGSDIPGVVRRIVGWLDEDVGAMHELVMALDAARKVDPEVGAAYVLVTESAANILGHANRTRAATGGLLLG